MSCLIAWRRPTAISINSGRVYCSSGLVDTFTPHKVCRPGIGMALLPVPSRYRALSATETRPAALRQIAACDFTSWCQTAKLRPRIYRQIVPATMTRASPG